MKNVCIIDEDATLLAKNFNGIARQDRIAIKFHAHQNPEKLFEDLKSGSVPDLALLHHNWEGAKIGNLLERTATLAPSIRVIVFTGQNVKIGELIECVRAGVADYWTEGTLTAEAMFRQIVSYCDSPSSTMEALRLSSGSLRQLLTKAERETELRQRLEEEKGKLIQRVQLLESGERAETRRVMMTVVKVLVGILTLAGSFIAIMRYTAVDPIHALSFEAIGALFLLFLEGRISEAFINWTQGSARIKSSGSDEVDGEPKIDRTSK